MSLRDRVLERSEMSKQSPAFCEEIASPLEEHQRLAKT
jgi:hypothetical protein